VHGIASNAEMRVPEVRTFCELESSGATLLRSATERLGLSARAYHRVLRVARTIADLAGEERIAPMHLAEAIQYQPRSAERRTSVSIYLVHYSPAERPPSDQTSNDADRK
jgi:predicted ATPase with chaperone activity